jgi:hypothetical protein
VLLQRWCRKEHTFPPTLRPIQRNDSHLLTWFGLQYSLLPSLVPLMTLPWLGTRHCRHGTCNKRSFGWPFATKETVGPTREARRRLRQSSSLVSHLRYVVYSLINFVGMIDRPLGPRLSPFGHPGPGWGPSNEYPFSDRAWRLERHRFIPKKTAYPFAFLGFRAKRKRSFGILLQIRSAT